MAMEINVGSMDGVLVWSPVGRFGRFRELMPSISDLPELDAAAQWMILDLKQVAYLSSAGIRSLVKLGKLLHQRKGRVVVTGASDFVGHTMSMAGLSSFLHVAASVPEAAQLIAADELAAQLTSQVEVDRRTYTVLRLPPSPCTIEMWGGNEASSGESVDSGKLISASLEELDLAFGLGGSGNDRVPGGRRARPFRHYRSHGLGVAGGRSMPAGFHPHGKPCGHATPPGNRHGDIRPAQFLPSGEFPTVSLENLAGDIFRLVSAALKAPVPILGLLFSAESVSLSGTFFAMLEISPAARRRP